MRSQTMTCFVKKIATTFYKYIVYTWQTQGFGKNLKYSFKWNKKEAGRLMNSTEPV